MHNNIGQSKNLNHLHALFKIKNPFYALAWSSKTTSSTL
jgi:hypothetical protein